MPRKPLRDVTPRPSSKSSVTGLRSLAGRKFSFGGQKKHASPNQEIFANVPSLPSPLPERHDTATAATTTDTAALPGFEEAELDMGGDFGSILRSFNRRSSQATLTLEGPSAPKSAPGGLRGLDASLVGDASSSSHVLPKSTSDGSPAATVSNSTTTGAVSNLSLGTSAASSFAAKASSQPSYSLAGGLPSPVEDEETTLLQDSLVAGRYLSRDTYDSRGEVSGHREGNYDKFSSAPRRPIHSIFAGTSTLSSNSPLRPRDDNLFSDSLARTHRVSTRTVSRPGSLPQNKVMTPAQFEQYRQDKERDNLAHQRSKSAAATEEDKDEEEETTYDDDEDEMEKTRQQARQRRRQEANMAIYRQQMMKVTGEQPDLRSPSPAARPGLPTSFSAPLLSQLKTPSPDSPEPGSDDEDDEIPLAILQAHGFPHKDREPRRLNGMASNPSLSASAKASPPPERPASALGNSTSNGGQRQSGLPAFARHLPEDPFLGASISRPALRESMSFGAGTPGRESPAQLPPGGLVGIIASEERSKAMRRGSPSFESWNASLRGPPGPPFDPMPGTPHDVAYGSGSSGFPAAPYETCAMPGVHPQMHPQMYQQMYQQMPQPKLSAGEQAQIQMSQQMTQFLQMQMQIMHMMSGQQSGHGPQIQPPYAGFVPGSQSMVDLSGRHSVMGNPMQEPRYLDPAVPTSIMMRPSSADFMQPPDYAKSMNGSVAHYTPSIAPSERSNVGLPGRYRPVSQVPVHPPQMRAASRATVLHVPFDESANALEDIKSVSSTTILAKPSAAVDDDDDQEGWEAMKAKRDKKRSSWRGKKSFQSKISAVM